MPRTPQSPFVQALSSGKSFRAVVRSSSTAIVGANLMSLDAMVDEEGPVVRRAPSDGSLSSSFYEGDDLLENQIKFMDEFDATGDKFDATGDKFDATGDGEDDDLDAEYQHDELKNFEQPTGYVDQGSDADQDDDADSASNIDMDDHGDVNSELDQDSNGERDIVCDEAIITDAINGNFDGLDSVSTQRPAPTDDDEYDNLDDSICNLWFPQDYAPEEVAQTGSTQLDDGASDPEVSKGSSTTLVSDVSSGSPSSLKRKATDPLIDAPSSKRAAPIDEPSIFRDVQPAPLPVGPEEPMIIVHDHRHTNYYHRLGLRWGVLWELARLTTSGFKDPNTGEPFNPRNVAMAVLQKLKGCNAAVGPYVSKILSGEPVVCSPNDPYAGETAAKSPWEELDTEEAALKDDEYGGLGFNADHPDWYGGKVTFRATLKSIDGQFKFVLERAERGPSCRFTRRFGSWNFIRVKIAKDVLNKENNGLQGYFCRPFVIHGRVFRAFYAKDDNVFLVQTLETVSKELKILPASNSSDPRSSLWSFCMWHNPLAENAHQSMAKWATRFALGLSNSVPGAMLDEKDMLFIDDLMTNDSDQTDGCGYASRALLHEIAVKLQWDIDPVAIQCRTAGTKGLQMLHPMDDENVTGTSRIWMRKSQRKIKYPEGIPLDPAMRVVDVLRSSHLKTPGRLSAETMINLSHNGSKHGHFISLLQTEVQAVVDGLTCWEGTKELINLWCNIAHAGSVHSARQARANTGEARARGYGDRDKEDETELDEDEEALEAIRVGHEGSKAWWGDPVSGCPSSLEETCLYLLDAGFTPSGCAILAEKLKQVVKTQVKICAGRNRITVPMSLTAWMIPDAQDCNELGKVTSVEDPSVFSELRRRDIRVARDTTGYLKAGEIQVRSSRSDLLMPDGRYSNSLLGDVLITRNPCKLPSDTQKVRAVAIPELRHLVDVIVCSTADVRRFADYLAGGDYDGDKGLVIWDPLIVDDFRNSDKKFSVEPPDVAKSFQSQNEKGFDFLGKISSWDVTKKHAELQKYLLSALQDTSLVGKYSTYHEKATYMLGYDHPETIRLAYMFCNVLDRHKTGKILLPLVADQDKKKYNWYSRTLEWKGVAQDEKERKRQEQRLQQSNMYELRPRDRPPRLQTRPFVMDHMRRAALVLARLHCRRAEAKLKHGTEYGVADAELMAPWMEIVEKAALLRREESCDRLCRDLEAIKSHVEKAVITHQEQVTGSPGKRFTDFGITARQDRLRHASRQFHSGPPPEQLIFTRHELSRLRASYAYKLDVERRRTAREKWSRFPFNVAMRQLCDIKANSGTRLSKTVVEDYYQHFRIRQNKRKGQ